MRATESEEGFQVTAVETQSDIEKISNSNCLVPDQNRMRKINFEIMNLAGPFSTAPNFAFLPLGPRVSCWNAFVRSRKDTAQQSHAKQDENSFASQNKSKSNTESQQDKNNEKRKHSFVCG